MIVVIVAGFFVIILLATLGIFVLFRKILTRKNTTKGCKRALVALACVLVVLGLVFYGMDCFMEYQKDAPAHSLGSYKEKKSYTHGEFQDYTDYAVYTYRKVNVADNPYFKRATTADLWEIGKYIDHYEAFVKVIGDSDPEDEVFVNYTFDRSILDENDYFYLDANNQYSAFSDYDLWILDWQTGKLYFFHHNI